MVGEIDTFPAARSEIFGIFSGLDRIFFFVFLSIVFKPPVFRVQNTRFENQQ